MDTFTNKSFQANGVSSGVVGKAKKTQEPQLTGGGRKYKKNKKKMHHSLGILRLEVRVAKQVQRK